MSKNKPVIPTVVPEPIVAQAESNVAYGGRSPLVNSHLRTVEEYVNAMAPGMVVPDHVGLNWQNRLFNAILGILNLDNVADMIDGMDGLMDYFRAYKQGALHLQYTQRYIDQWVTDETTRDLYGHLCVILSTFCDPTKREMYGTKMRLTGADGILIHMEPEARNRLIQYLTRYVQ